MKKLQILLVIFVVVFTNFGGSAFADNLTTNATNELSTAEIAAPTSNTTEQITQESAVAEPTATTDDAPDTDTNDETEPSDNTPAVVNPIQIAHISTTSASATSPQNFFVQVGNFSDYNISINSLKIELFNSKNEIIKTYLLSSKPGSFTAKSFVVLGYDFADFDDFSSGSVKGPSLPQGTGAVKLLVNDEQVDQVCWGDSTICGGIVNNSAGSIPVGKMLKNTLLADTPTLSDARFALVDRTLPSNYGGFSPSANTGGDDPNAENSSTTPDDDTTPQNPDCKIAKLNEIGANLDAQFIEIANPTDRDLNLSGCQIMTNRSSGKKYVFGDEILPASSVLSIEIANTNLTLTKTTTGKVYFGDAITDYDEVDYANLPSKTSFAKFDDGWKNTYAPTPNAANIYQQYVACNDGYFRNLTTGRCNKLATISDAVKLCAADQFLNPETNRCKKIATTVSLTPCPAGSSRNPETNRCKKDTATTSTACPAGSSRNPETNRCRKDTANSSAQYPVKTASIRASETWKLVALAVVASTGLIVIWQFREEIGSAIIKFRARFQQREAE